MPNIGRAIQQYNSKNPAVRLNLAGIGIGNGMVSPAIQYLSYADYAKENGIISDQVKSD